MSHAAITHVRQQRKLSPAEVAHHTGLSVQHIRNLERGARPLTMHALRQLDKCLKFPTRILVALVRCSDAGAAERSVLLGLLLSALVLP